MMNDHSVLDTEVNGRIIGDTTDDLTDSTLFENVDNYESPSVVESGEASFPAPEELRSSRTSRSNRSIWKGSSSPKNSATTTKKPCRLYALLVAIVVLVCIVIIPAVVVSNKNQKTKEASALNDVDEDEDAENRPRPTLSDIVNYIVNQGISTETDILTADTPQYKAAMWLMRDDPANVPVPTMFDISTYEGYRYMTRYIMAVNYFAFDGENWEVDLGWMTGSDVCDWNRPVYISGTAGKFGLRCPNTGSADENGTIKRYPTSLVLSMWFT